MRAIGIDISDSTVEIAEMRQRFGAMSLLAISRKSIPSGIVEKGKFMNIDALSTHLKEACAQAKPQEITVSSAYFTIPESKVFTHVFTFPKELKQNDIQKAIELQFSEYFPYELSQTAYDWKVVHESGQTQMVLVGACEQVYVSQIVDLAKKAEIKVNGIDIESASTARALLPFPAESEAYLLVDSGANVTSLSLFDSAGLQSTFVIDMGGELITQRIVKEKGISRDEAEKLKRTLDLTKNQPADLVQIVHDIFQTVIEEAKRTIQFFEGSQRKTVKEAYLCGGTACIKGLNAYFQEQLALPTHLGDPLPKMKHRDILKGESEILLYANVIGMNLGVLDRKYHHTRFNFLSHIK